LASGDIFRGQFINGSREGKGCLEQSDGSLFDGDWINDKLHGYGCARLASGMSYRGYFREGKYHGWGVRRWSGGSTYIGMWWKVSSRGTAHLPPIRESDTTENGCSTAGTGRQ
jgi:hypothetical protein